MRQPKINEKHKLILKDFDLTSDEIFDRILETAQLKYTATTPNDPPTRAGMDVYFAVVRALREILMPKGWEKCDEGNQAKVHNRKKGVQILVSSGNADTGIEEKTPKTNNPKGPKTLELVERNEDQLLLFPIWEPLEKEGLVTWVFLYYITGNEMRCELSQPLKMDNEERIVSWGERIIPSMKLEDIVKSKTQAESFAPIPEIQVFRKEG